LKIIGGKVFKGGIFKDEPLYIKDGIITDTDPADGEVVDAKKAYVIPGLVDIHSHGAVGHDFCDADVEGLKKITEYERSVGVTSYCPTSMTFDEDKLAKVFATAKAYKKSPESARVVGINMEGPFIAPEKKGAQNGKYIKAPDVDMFERLNEVSGGLIKLTTIAPERPNALEFIKKLSGKAVMSIGHTTSDYDTAMKAIEAGADHVTHLCNAMPPLNHREPGVIGAAADNKNVYVELICDGIHIHYSMIRRIYEMFGADRICLISDSMEATGMPDGDYALGGQKVIKKGRHATLTDGTLAGSASNLFDCVRCAVEAGIPLEDAIKMATINPAKSIGVDDKVGSLEAGRYGDVLIVNDKLKIEKII